MGEVWLLEIAGGAQCSLRSLCRARSLRWAEQVGDAHRQPRVVNRPAMVPPGRLHTSVKRWRVDMGELLDHVP